MSQNNNIGGIISSNQINLNNYPVGHGSTNGVVRGEDILTDGTYNPLNGTGTHWQQTITTNSVNLNGISYITEDRARQIMHEVLGAQMFQFSLHMNNLIKELENKIEALKAGDVSPALEELKKRVSEFVLK